MLPRSIRLLPLLPLLPLLALTVGCTPRLDYEQVCTRDPSGPPIDVVNVESEDERVRLSVYAAGEEVVVWETAPPPAPQAAARLAPGERYFRSADGGVVGVRRLERVSPAPTPGRVARRTSLRLLGRAARLSQLPGALDGAFEPHISADASTLLLASAPARGPGPLDVRIFRRAGPPPGVLVAEGSYSNPRRGTMQVSRSGDVIAQEDGAEVRILGPRGVERRRIPGGIGFQLAPSGRVLAVREPDAVAFHALGAPPAAPVRVPLTDFPQEVEIQRGHALLRTRAGIALVDPETGLELWSWEAPEGVVTSADLYEDPTGKRLVAVGRLDIRQPTLRTGGSVSRGEARAFVDVLDAGGERLVRTHSFSTSRWNDGAPDVELVADGRRVLVRCGDVVLISEALP